MLCSGSQTFDPRDWFCGGQLFHRSGEGDDLGMSQVHSVYCALSMGFSRQEYWSG